MEHLSGCGCQHRFTVGWSGEDGEFVATTDRFPSLSFLHADPVAALQGLLALVEVAASGSDRCPGPAGLTAGKMLSGWAPPKLSRYVVERWGHGREWLAGLDRHVAVVAGDLGLTGLQVHPGSNRTLVLRAVRGGEAVAVKFDPDPLAGDAGNAVDAWAAAGAAPPRAAPGRPGVDVRYWWPGSPLRRCTGDDARVLAATTELFRVLAGTPAPPVARSAPEELAAQARQAIARSAALTSTVRAELQGLPGYGVDLVAVAARLAPHVDGNRLCHGDLTPNNVLLHGSQVVLLDPEPCAGSLATDAARWSLRVALSCGVPVERAVDAAVEAAGLEELLVWELVWFGAITYAVYLLTFGRAVPDRLWEICDASYGRCGPG